VTITDNDALPPAGSLQFSASGYVVDENGGSVVVTVNRTGGSFGVVNVNYSTSDGSAKAGSDFASTSGKLIFADGVLSQTFSVSILDDTNYEGDEIFAVGLSNATGGATIGSPFAAAVTIADNDPAPQFGSLQFQAGTYTVAEDGVSLSVTVTRTGGSSGEVKVNYSTADASASAGNDYTATIGTLTFPDGVTSQSFSVSIFDDAVYEGDEQFSLQLTNATGGASLGVPANATVTITENDAPPSFGSLQFGSGTYSVSESGVTATVTVIRTGGSDGIVSVDYATSDLSASAGSDYVSASDSLIFADGELSQSFTVTILDDLDYEGDEIFAVSLSAVTGGAAIGVPASTVITISEDDSPPSAGSLQFTGSRYSVAEDGAAIEITVSRVGGDFGAVTVGYSTSDISAKSGSDYVLVSDTLSFADGQTSQSFFVPIIDDAEYEGDETFSVSLVNATGGAIISSPSNATVTITENDPVPPAGSLQFSGSSYSAMETDGILQVTVTRTGGSFGSVTVDYATSNISATAGSDYTAANGTLTFADGVISQVVNLAITDDAIYEGDETLSIALSKATGGAFIGMPNSATVRIIENDVPPPGGSLQFSGSNYPVQENAGTVSITVTRTGGSFGEVSVNYATSNGSAIAGSDYTAGSGTLVFADSVMSRTFDISVVDDTVYEGTETFTVSLSGVSADASIGSPSSATLTIGDNDPRPPVTPPASGGGGGGAIGPFGLVLALCGLAIGRRRKMIKGSSRRAVGRPFAMIAGLLIAVPLVGAATEQGEAPDPHAGHKMMMQQNTLQRSTHEYVYEGIPVTNMQGEASTLGEQVGDDRIVVVNFIFTTCTTICPVQSATLAQVQRQLGEKAGDVTMISVSIDPEHDTPARLREYSQLFKAGPQWQFLTGSADDMIRIQKAFDAYHGAKMNHRPLTFIKTPGETRWLRLEGMASAADIVGELQSIMSH
jgi:cytochrome oxidase Cu insertion factor (SCO1/SenC/PrrC family)